MVAVDTIDALKYGFRLLGYMLAVFIAGGLLAGIGAGFSGGPMDSGNPILAILFMIAGIAIIYAGGLGIFYKVIADGVEVGVNSAK